MFRRVLFRSLHTLSDVEDLPGKVGTDCRFEKLSTDRSDCRLSFAAPVGVLLSCNHVYNQFIFIDDHAENLKNFEQTARNMQSLSRYSRANQVNKEWFLTKFSRYLPHPASILCPKVSVPTALSYSQIKTPSLS